MKKTFIKLVSILTAIMIVSGMLAGINFSSIFAVTVDAVNMSFDGTHTATTLTEKGFAASGQTLETVAGYIADGKITFPKATSPIGFYSPAISDDSYTVTADVTVNDVTAAGVYNILIGAADAAYANLYSCEIGTNSSKVTNIRVRKVNASGTADNNNPLIPSTNISPNSNRIDQGAVANITIEVRYNTSANKTTVTMIVASGGTERIRGSFEVDGKLHGRVALYKAHTNGSVSFDNFKITADRASGFDMSFAGSYTAGALTTMGFVASGQTLETVAGYIADGKITYPKATSPIGFYSPAISDDSYTVTADMTVNDVTAAGVYNILIGAADAAYANLYSCEIGTNSSKVTNIRVRKVNASGTADNNNPLIPSTNISPNSNRIDQGAVANITIEVRYNTSANKTTVTMIVASGGTERIRGSFEVDGKLHGRVALYKAHTNGSVSFDNFKAVPYEKPLDENTYFFDDFEDNDSMTDKGWSHAGGTKANGVFTVDSGKFSYTSNVEDAATWGDYAVTAKVKTGITAVPTDDSSNIASIVARTASTSSAGYEFRISVDKNGTYYHLYKRGVSGGKINGADQKLTKTIDLTATHNLKIIVMGARVLCYNGDELIFDVTDAYADGNTYSAGYAGLRAPAGTATYDDFTVRKITDAEKQAIEALTPTTPPEGGDEDDDDDTITDENIIYADDFESSKTMAQKGWNANSETGTKANGVFTLDVGKATYLNGITDSDKWDDYVVEADMRYNNATIAEGSATVVNLVARSSKTTTNGYEFGFRYNADGSTELRLYKRLAKDSALKKMEHTLPYTILPDTLYHAKMVVLGDRIICYFNGIKVFDVIDDEAYMEGYAGIRNAGSGFSSTYDNFVVRKILTTDIVDDKKIEKLEGDIWFKDSFDGENSLSERGWNSDAAEFENGSASLVRTTNSMYITGVDGSEKWTDYTVTATVEIDKTKGLFADQTMGASWIVARSTKTTSSGYEFGIMSYSSGKYNLRLYDRTDKEDILVVNNYEVTDGAHELKMICQANVIRCYFDGELVITATDDTNKAGYAGLRASGYVTNYDNFTVSAIKEEQKLDIVTPESEETVKSPATGVARVACTVVAPISFALSAVALIITAVWAIINRKKIF